MSQLIDIVLAQEQQEGTTSTLARWVVEPGAAVVEHEPVAEIETDKVVVEIAAPASGTLAECLKAEGDPIEPGEVLGRIAAGSAATAKVAASAGSKRSVTRGGGAGEARLSPAVRRLLEEHGLDAKEVRGSGRAGRISAQDVEAHVAATSRGGMSAAVREQDGPGAVQPGRIVAHGAMRRRIADHMVESLLRTSPHVTSVFEADLSLVLAHRADQRSAFERDGIRLTLTAYHVFAACRALQAVPEVNARFHPDHLEIFDDINIGIGTALGDEGLIVPVIRRVQDLDLRGVATALSDLTERARSGKLQPAEVRGGTFTISNHGTGGSLIAAPIVINQPQVAILGIGKMEKRVVAVERDGRDEMVIQPRCYVTLSIDHRALDGFQTNRFLTTYVETLENWGRDGV